MRPHTNNVIVKDIIDKLIEYSKISQADSSNKTDKFITAYNEAKIQLIIIRHHVDSFEYLIEQEELISKEILDAWLNLEADYKDFEQNLKTFLYYLKINKTKNIQSLDNLLFFLGMQHENLRTIFHAENLPILDKIFLS